MKRSCQRRSVVLVFLALGFTSQAHADPVTVTSGRFVLHQEQPFFDFNGAGFRITGEFDQPFRPGIFPLEDCLICTAGATIRLGSHVQGKLAEGAAIFNGVSRSTAFYSGDLLFDAPSVTAPDTQDFFIKLVRPFTLTGTLNAFGSTERTGTPLFIADLRGTGLVTFSLLNPVGEFNFSDLTYRFEAAATPEPGTMSLLGSGIAGVMLRSRQRRKRLAR